MQGAWGQSERFYSCIHKTFSGVLEGALRGGVGPGWKAGSRHTLDLVHMRVSSSE